MPSLRRLQPLVLEAGDRVLRDGTKVSRLEPLLLLLLLSGEPSEPSPSRLWCDDL